MLGSGAGRKTPEALERPGQLSRPGPGGVKAQDEAPPAAHEPPGYMPGAIAQSFGLATGQGAFEAQPLRPCLEVQGDEHDEQPGGVGGETVAGET